MTPAMAAPRRTPVDAAIYLTICGVAAFILTIAVAMSKDPLFQFEGYIFIAGFMAGAVMEQLRIDALTPTSSVKILRSMLCEA